MARTATARSKTKKPARDAVVNLRLSAAERALIDSAATAMGKTRTAFILDSSRTLATDVLLDQRLFTLSSSQFNAFMRALDKSPQPNAKLKALMSSKATWDK